MIGEGLVGQAALDKKTIAISDAPPGYIKVGSGLGEATPADILVMPVLFEDQALGVIELASIRPFSEVHRDFLARIGETIGVVLNTIRANLRTEELLTQSQSLTTELQKQSEEFGRRTMSFRRRRRFCLSRTAISRSRTRRSSSRAAGWRIRRRSWLCRRSTSRSSWRICRTSCGRR